MIAGRTLFTGAAGAALMTPDWLLVTGIPGPVAFDAVTRTRKVAPWSAATNRYDGLVAPPMSAQDAPLLLQRDHW